MGKGKTCLVGFHKRMLLGDGYMQSFIGIEKSSGCRMNAKHRADSYDDHRDQIRVRIDEIIDSVSQACRFN